jgi:hypothetical protein
VDLAGAVVVPPEQERVFAPLSELRDEPVIVLAAASGIGKSTASSRSTRR